ncbi:MAG: hypothetical protein ABSH16_03735 [Sedimentisphaerales bacterium]
MKTLKVWVIVIVMLAVSVPSFGYILVYNTFGRIRAVDSITNTLAGVMLRGYLVLDINDNNAVVDDFDWICYGKDGEGDKVYMYNTPDDLQIEVDGRYETLYIDVPSGWQATLFGRITNRNIGLGSKQAIAYTMSGNLILLDSFVFDDQTLRGGGSMSMTLNSTQTINANADANDVAGVTNTIEAALGVLGYQ